MTTGQFHTGAITSITIARENRQRRELTNIAELALSIQSIGLINPILVTRDLILVAGERRLEACKSLGWDKIPYQFTDEIDTSELQLIELEENVKRVDLAWPDKVAAVRSYHELTLAKDNKWTVEKTGAALGYTSNSVYDMLNVSKEIERNPKLVELPQFSVARGVTSRARERRASDTIASISGGPALIQFEAPPAVIANVDFEKWLETYTGPKFNLIHCDFPYGINLQASDQAGLGAHGGYEDGPEIFNNLVSVLAKAMSSILAPSAHLVFWFSPKHYEMVCQALYDMGWDVNPYPLIWLKSDNAGILPDPARGPRQIYEMAFLASCGDRKIIRAKSNAYAAPSSREIHSSEKSEPMLRYFFEMLVDENTVMLDPTAGSGSALRAADSLGAKHVIGLELNANYAKLANEKFNAARKLRGVK